MKTQTDSRSGATRLVHEQAELDLVIPLITPDLTRSALAAADRMAAGLNARVRLVKVQPVPYPLDVTRSPVDLDFLKDQMAQFQSELPITHEIRLAREVESGLAEALRPGSVVILATRKRPWKTRTARLAEWLRRKGYQVALVSQDANQTISTEADKCSISSTVC